MPIGSQSLQPYTPTIFTAQTAVAYKTNLDGNSSVLSNSAGSFYVYPASPANMTVLVDAAFNYPQLASGMQFSATASPVSVTLVAPGSNSRIACIYWDSKLNSAGVQYSTISASPVATLPDFLYQLPLAFVTLTSTTTNIQATNIQDCRTLQYSPLVVDLGTVGAGTVNINCFGANSVSLRVTTTTSVTSTLNFQNLSIGAYVQFVCSVTVAGSATFRMTGTTNGGAAYAMTGISQTFTTNNLASVGYALTTSQSGIFVGSTLLVTGTPTMYGFVN